MEDQQSTVQQPEPRVRQREMEEPLQHIGTKSQSTRSRSSEQSSRSSTASSAAIKARAKADAARAQVSYAEKEASVMKQKAEIEASLLKQKADLEASLYVLQFERTAAAALAEAAAFEEAVGSERRELHKELDTGTQPLSPVQRTCEYVQQHARPYFAELPFEVEKQELSVDPATYYNPESSKQQNMSRDSPFKRNEQQHGVNGKQAHFQSHTQSVPESQVAPDLIKYLLRREMVSSGLLKFDDRPENYWAWKASFLNAIRDLNLSAREELDLITKWLGAESSEQANRIRSVHIFNATAGLNMVWQRLEECYGTPEVIENALLKKIDDFPKLANKDNHKLRELGDILLELECAKVEGYLPGLAYLDTSRGVNPIVEKLPFSLQEKWIAQGSKYKEDYRVAFPPFSFFSRFIRNQAKTRNDPSFTLYTATNQVSMKSEKPARYSSKTPVTVYKTDVSSEPSDHQTKPSKTKIENPDHHCPIHNKPHPLKKCRGFRYKTLDERKSYLKENGICFRCCGSTQHRAKDCKVSIKCSECDSDRHLAALHPGPAPSNTDTATAEKEHGGEQGDDALLSVTSKCTEICGEAVNPRSCSKICLVKAYPAGKREKAVKMYVVLDEQSNKSLAKTEFFNLFNINDNSAPYTMKTCSGVTETSGRRAVNFMVESIDGHMQLSLPTLIECDMMPDDRTEIPSPDIAYHHPHLQPVMDKIPAVDPDAPILLLLGRDILRVHKVREQINGPHDTPYAQRLDLGWVIVGEVCLGTAHRPANVNVFRTNILQNGRTSYLSPCPDIIQVKENYNSVAQKHISPSTMHSRDPNTTVNTDNLGCSVFDKTQDDDKPAPSVEDKAFLDIMDKQVFQDDGNNWVAPLPFRPTRRRLPNNREQAINRLTSLRRTLDKKPDMKRHFIDFMQKMLDNDQAEPSPPLEGDKECWYLPIFGVYHPQKPEQIRVVFDSSAKCQGVSLNDVLLSGPDLNNTLLGVLMRFRKDCIALTADVQQMFYCFGVREDHRDYLRFLWYEDNNPDRNITEYRMKVHVFGNSPSPAVAIYCMRRAALQGEKEHGSEPKQYVVRNFYVDDGLTSVATTEEAINILRKTQAMLAESNMKLHKIASNSKTVMEAFPMEDRAKDLKDLDLGVDPLPFQRSLGLSWNLETDSFSFQVSHNEKPFTRRGILSTVNSLYDPLGFVAPITMQGKALIRELSSDQSEWDAPLPPEKEEKWKMWKDSLMELEHMYIQRTYIPVSLSTTQRRELHIFSDASTVAIGAVAYLRVIDSEGQCHVGFVMGKSKLAPRPAHTIPRLELCAALLAVEMYELIRDEIDIDVNVAKFYTDSKIVLGYIRNVTKRFYVYVANRVTRIRKSTHPDQWCYVNTDSNPADHATRPILAALLKYTSWFSGPPFLTQTNSSEPENINFDLVEPHADAEIRPDVTVFASKVSGAQLGSHRFERFSSWKALNRATARLIHVARSFHEGADNTSCRGWHDCNKPCGTSELSQAKTAIIHCVQHEAFREEFKCLEKGKEFPKQSTLKKPFPVLTKRLGK
ncbi:uncharacterized protein [Salvelinus alpinus]|uniref:uncharacterized protein n=1 Tax=Salvelinus alpinus TaxID=8036 RepID=UPI0039FB8D61